MGTAASCPSGKFLRPLVLEYLGLDVFFVSFFQALFHPLFGLCSHQHVLFEKNVADKIDSLLQFSEVDVDEKFKDLAAGSITDFYANCFKN
jgi:hypothetical protein